MATDQTSAGQAPDAADLLLDRVKMVERVARIIDPEAFGLPPRDRSAEAGGYLTCRDEARQVARDVMAHLAEAGDAASAPDAAGGRIHVDWEGVPAWRQRLGAWCQFHAAVTIGRWLGAEVTVWQAARRETR